MAKKSGVIYETSAGRFGLAVNSEQEQEFVKLKKVLVYLFEDRLMQKPVMLDGKPCRVLKDFKLLKQVGFSD